MKLKDYRKSLNKLVKEFPELLECEVIYSIDNEGNDYKKVYYMPSAGILHNGKFFGEYETKRKINVICLN